MRLSLPVLLSAFLLTVNSLHAQVTNPGGCGTVGMTDWFKWYADHRDQLIDERGEDTTRTKYALTQLP